MTARPRLRAPAGFAALGLALIAPTAHAGEVAPHESAAVCPDSSFPLDLSVGGTPVATLKIGDRTGAFLIDTGATTSAVDAKSFGLAAGAVVRLVAGLCGQGQADFRVEDMRPYRAAGGQQLGRLGDDLLGRLALEIETAEPSPALTVRAGPLDRAALEARGFTEIDRPAPQEARVPTINLAIGAVTVPAQLDTGFADDVDPGLVQGNAAFIEALRAHGVALRPAPAATTLGCAGLRSYPRWRIDGAELVLMASDGARAATYAPPLIEIKDDDACGGIAAFPTPFVQIGASWLGRFGTTILDGPGRAVWISARPTHNAR